MSDTMEHLKEFNLLDKEKQQALVALTGPRKEEWEKVKSFSDKLVTAGFTPDPFTERFFNKKTNKQSLHSSFKVGPAMVRYVNLDNPAYYDKVENKMVTVTDPEHKDFGNARFSITLWVPIKTMKDFSTGALKPYFESLKADSGGAYKIAPTDVYNPKNFIYPPVKRVPSDKDISYPSGSDLDFREIRIKGYPLKYGTTEVSTFDCKGINNETIPATSIKQGDMVMVSGQLRSYSAQVDFEGKLNIGISFLLNQSGKHSIQLLRKSTNPSSWTGSAGDGGSTLSADQLSTLQTMNLESVKEAEDDVVL